MMEIEQPMKEEKKVWVVYWVNSANQNQAECSILIRDQKRRYEQSENEKGIAANVKKNLECK